MELPALTITSLSTAVAGAVVVTEVLFFFFLLGAGLVEVGLLIGLGVVVHLFGV